MAKVIYNLNNQVPVLKMKDGEVAVILSWGSSEFDYYKGKVVQRYENALVSIGEPSGFGWSRLFENESSLRNCYVEILKPGSQIEL